MEAVKDSPEQVIAQLRQENNELHQMLMIQKRSADLKMRCVEEAVKSGIFSDLSDITDHAEQLFKYVTSQNQ